VNLETLVVLLRRLAPLAVTIVVCVLILFLLNRTLRKHWSDNPDAQFRFQLIMLALSLAAVVAVVLALPIIRDSVHSL
jgi:small conductance mechanosensitive channel